MIGNLVNDEKIKGFQVNKTGVPELNVIIFASDTTTRVTFAVYSLTKTPECQLF